MAAHNELYKRDDSTDLTNCPRFHPLQAVHCSELFARRRRFLLLQGQYCTNAILDKQHHPVVKLTYTLSQKGLINRDNLRDIHH